MWALLKPLTMFLVLLAVFSFVFANDPQYKLDLIIGLFLYEFFQESTKAGLLSIRAKGYLLTRARFPSWIVVVTSASNAVITLGLFSVVLIVFLAVTGRPPSPAAVVLYVLYQLQFLAIVAGFSLAASVLFMRYRDLNQVWEVVTQAGFFIAPIVYPLEFPERVHAYLYAWPPTPSFFFAKRARRRARPVASRARAVVRGTAVILGAGLLIYRARASA